MNQAEASSPVSRLVITNDSSTPTFDKTIRNYRLRKNSNFKVFFIGSGTRNPKNTEHVIYVDGCNEQVLRYMSEAGKNDVILRIQSFPTKFGIELDAFSNLSPLDVYVPRINLAKFRPIQRSVDTCILLLKIGPIWWFLDPYIPLFKNFDRFGGSLGACTPFEKLGPIQWYMKLCITISNSDRFSGP